MVSPELKTPLTSLTAIVQVANGKLKTSEDKFLSGAMEKANIQVKRMINMIMVSKCVAPGISKTVY